MNKVIRWYNKSICAIRSLDFLVLFLLRIYLAPIFVIAGLNKLHSFDSTAEWLGNSDWGLGLPMPVVMTALVVFAELVGGFALLFGVLTRFFAFLLGITMAVAAWTVHLKNGWFAIASTDGATSIASFWVTLGFGSAKQSLQNASENAQRLDKAREILQEHGNYEWLTEMGNFVILNNGIEFAATYCVMILVLLVYGGGKYLSIDYWLSLSKFFASKPKS